MSKLDEMVGQMEEKRKHEEVVKALDWTAKYVSSLLRPFHMEIKRNFQDNPATISIAVFWKEPEEPKKERDKVIVSDSELEYDNETGEWVFSKGKDLAGHGEEKAFKVGKTKEE